MAAMYTPGVKDASASFFVDISSVGNSTYQPVPDLSDRRTGYAALNRPSSQEKGEAIFSGDLFSCTMHCPLNRA